MKQAIAVHLVGMVVAEREIAHISRTTTLPAGLAGAFESTIGWLVCRILKNLEEAHPLAAQNDALLPNLVSEEGKGWGSNKRYDSNAIC